MPDCPVVVTVTPEDGHWRLSARGARSATCGSLRRAEIVAQRLTGPDVAIDVQVSVDGLEDLCADAVELGRESDAASIQALRLKRLAVRALTRAGVKQADIGYLLGISTERADDMRSEPVDSPWMARGQTPWRPRPDLTVPEPAIPGSKRVVAVVVTRAPAKTTWFLHLDDEPERVRTLAVAEARVRELVGADTDVLICPVSATTTSTVPSRSPPSPPQKPMTCTGAPTGCAYRSPASSAASASATATSATCSTCMCIASGCCWSDRSSG